MADFSAWEAYKAITVQDANVDGNLTDFPCLVVLDADSDIGGRSQAAGQDLRFTLSDGSTQLKHEIENFSVAGGNASANIWVKVPSVAASGGASIRIYYGNDGAGDGQDAANVWDANYKAVWHLRESSGTAIDSTGNGYSGTFVGSLPNSVSAKIANGQEYDGAGDYITTSGITHSGAFTVSFVAQRDTVVGANDILFGLKANYFAFFIYENGNILLGTTGGAITYTWSGVWTDKTAFHHITFVADGSGGDYNHRLYFDGVSQGGDLDNISDIAEVRIGETILALNRSFDGIIDEGRVSTTNRSTNWVKFEYHNIFEADNELTWGAEVVTPSGAIMNQLQTANLGADLYNGALSV